MQDLLLLNLTLPLNAASVAGSNLSSAHPSPPAAPHIPSDLYNPTTTITTAIRRGYVQLFLAAIGMLTLTFTAITANILVIVIFFKHRRLRRCKNVYLVGLSFADLGVGLCMPLALADEMLWGWAPGGIVCRLYLVVRDSLLVISLITVLQVSVDRWWSIHRPFNYRVRQSKSTATIILALTWVITFLIQLPLTGIYDVITAFVTSSPAASNETLGQLLENIGGSALTGDHQQGKGLTSANSLCSSRYVKVAPGGPVTCDVPYRSDVGTVIVLSLFRYLAPFLFLLVLNVTLYAKIRERKRVEVRRSISGIDTVLFSLLKASSSDSECNNEESSHLLRAQRAERRLSRLSPAPLNRRHTMSQILFPGVGFSPSPTLHHSPRQSRPLRRRVSLQDCLQNSGYSSSLQVPRRKSQALGLTQSLSDSLLPQSRRQSREDLAKDMMIKQDKRAACFLGLLQGVLLLCWTPLTVVSIVNATTHSSPLPRWTQPVSLWLLLANSAINPFLYGLFNNEFSKVVMHWFKIKGSKRDRLKTALRRFSMHIAVELEKNGYTQTATFETVVE